MRVTLALIVFCTAAVAMTACGGGSKTASPTAAASSLATKAAASPTTSTGTTATAATGNQEATVEVTGIVGTASTSTRLIEIDRLSGANVRRISVDPSTVLRKAAGGTTTLSQIRASNRIIARGTLNDRGDTLQASEITVQDVVPGAQPGG